MDPASLVSPRALSGETEFFELWPENRKAYDVFRLCRHQWNVVGGFQEPAYVGMRAEALSATIADLGIKGSDRRRVREQLAVMEEEGLLVLREQ